MYLPYGNSQLSRMRKLYYLASTIFCLIALSLIAPKEKEISHRSYEEGESAIGRAEWELARLADPATGRIPPGIRAKELAFAATLPKMDESVLRMDPQFQFRGPVNLGGRTRALAIDVTDENIIIVGSANGGLWRSVNGGVTWNRVSSLSGTQSITWLAQDTRPGKTNIWYYSTGEAIGSSASGGRAYYLGNGLFKSVDGGITWNQIASTASNTPASFDNVWDLSWRVALDPSDTVNDVVYVATYGAIWRSNNGGTNWTVQRGNASGSAFSYFTDVDVATTGVVYATLSSDGPQRGVWRKAPTGAWTNITPPTWTDTINRVVIGINPSNENEVYFLGETPHIGKMTTNWQGDQEWNSLWKYTYVSGDGSGAGGVWTDLSAQIPYDGSELGNFNCQGGYDLIVKVHPTQPNVVFIGGTNLYRSIDGFTSDSNTVLIGGYDPATTIPYYLSYANHHSDQHNIAFLPSNPSVMYQANDGGMYKTNDCMASTVSWIDLNNGYRTGQFYTIALDHGTPGDDQVMGGTQDYGTWLTYTSNNQTPWHHVGLGDGAYCAMDNGHQFYYTSRQQGRLVKTAINASGIITGYNRIDPATGGDVDYLFINPFVLDPNNNDVMYWVAGKTVWRNDSLTSIPLSGDWNKISTGWFMFPDSVTYANAYITALAVSNQPAHRVYYGTSNRYLYKVDNANTMTPVTTEITNAAFPSSGYISCIAVDPMNADRILVVFSNYQVYSLYLSTDGGVTFSKSAGNLEVNSVGTGNGPSLRWASIVPVSGGYVYLIGASTGLYATTRLNGLSTVWTQMAPSQIGNLVTDMMDYRISDGRVVIGTHGGGVFSTTLTDTILTALERPMVNADNVKVYPNPAADYLMISTDESLADDQITVFDLNGREVYRQRLGSRSMRIDVSTWSSGVYYVRIGTDRSIVKKVMVQ